MIGHRFDDWAAIGAGPTVWNRCSPNLGRIREVLTASHGYHSLGCYARRPIRTGEKPSTHSYGAAIDLAYVPEERDELLEVVIVWLVAFSFELELQAIHDYRGSRIWRAGRTPREMDACEGWWKAQRTDSGGMGQPWASWIHLETTKGGWGNATPVLDRGVHWPGG